MRIEQVTINENGFAARTDVGMLSLETWSDSIIRVTLKPDSREVPSPLDILPSDRQARPVVTETGGMVCLSTAMLRVELDKSGGTLTWFDVNGRLLLTQPAPQLAAKPVIRYAADNADIKKVQTIDGERSFVENLREYEDRTAWKVKVFFGWRGGEAVYGLGQGEEGILNYRGSVQYLYQNNMRIPIPFFQSSEGYGVLFDTGSLMTFNDDTRGSYLFLDTVDILDYYFIRGERPDDIIAGFRSLTGPAVLPPKWAFGYIQSKEAYLTGDELVEVAEEYRRRHIPLDCVVQDWNTWIPGLWGNKRVDKSRYPDLAATNRALHDMNVHSMVSVWPNMNEGGGDYEELREPGMLLADGSTYNAFDEKARAVYWRQADRELFSGGFDSWWCDSTEPFCGPDWSGGMKREPWERYALVGGELKKFLDPAYANLYALYHARGIYENQRRQRPDMRVLNLTRSGSPGSQRYGATLWSGDISATWDTLRRQITEGVNVGLSGMPWWTLDIGGFFTVREKWQNRGCGASGNPEPLWFWDGDFNDGVDDPGYRELYIRWLQIGTFLPMMRSHGTDTPREIWRFGEPGSIYYDTIEAFIRLRYRLLPTIYSLAGRAALDGYTMLRGLAFDFGHDAVAREIGDQFMLGDSLLVCPVTEPMRHRPNGVPLQKEETRRCYLPSGTGWYDYWSGEYHEGGQWITAPAPLDRIPLFARAGSILALETAELEYAGQVSDQPLLIQVWPGSDAKFLLYEDAGDGYGYESGEYNRILLRWNDAEKSLEIGGSAHDFPQSMRGRGFVVRCGSKTSQAQYTGEPVCISLQ